MSAFNAQEQAAITESAECVTIGDATLYRADCIALMRALPESSIDSIVTDPPYGISFMGKAWDGADIVARTERRRAAASHAPNAGPNGDHKSITAEAGKYDLTPAAMRAFQDFSEEWAREAFRVLKPGGHLLSFASARTYHRMACGIENSGFEVRDQIMWIFGSGFPKAEIWSQAKATKGNAECSKMIEAGFEGWARGGLKPAHEPILVARKPFAGNVAGNVLKHGTGAINVDGCRVDTGDVLSIGAGGTWDALKRHEGRPSRDGEASAKRCYVENGSTNFAMLPGIRGGDPAGRFPSNVIHDGSDEVLAAFPDAAGQQGRITGSESAANGFSGPVKFSGFIDRVASAEPRADSTKSAARFYYCAKTSRTDRNEGAEHLPQKQGGMVSNTSGQHVTQRDEGYKAPLVGNNHPTVKPTDLMAYLCRLVTPAGGVVLDPFMGSGSTGKAAAREGFRFVGIEIGTEYFPIAVARIQHEIDAIAAAVIADAAAAKELARQADLFAEREA